MNNENIASLDTCQYHVTTMSFPTIFHVTITCLKLLPRVCHIITMCLSSHLSRSLLFSFHVSAISLVTFPIIFFPCVLNPTLRESKVVLGNLRMGKS